MNNQTSEQLRQVRSALREAREWLMIPSPANIEQSVPHLEAAIAGMKSIEISVGAGNQHLPEIRTGIEAVRRELRTVNALLEQSAAIHRNWSGLMGAAASGYDGSGQPGVAPSGLSRITAKG